jgi:hypothetical protein
VLISQPLAELPSQLPKPALQVMPQSPAAQVAVPLVLLQTVLQPPQCVGVLRLVSQPLAALPSQSPKPGAQAIPQLPAVHVGVPPAGEHFVPQALQLLTSVLRLISQPLPGRPSQSLKPALQAPITQAPFEHVPVALAKVHLLPQPLQLLASVFWLTSQPLVGEASQFPKPEVQAPIAQMPVLHVAAAFV